MEIRNLTPHHVRLNDGREFPPAGPAPRVSTVHSEFDADGICTAQFGAVQGLPAPEEGVLFVVSGMVAQAARRPDVVAPATGHPAAVRRDGQVYSVPGWIRG